MTEKKITYALNRIKASKENGTHVEALLKSYHLNFEILKFILASISPSHVFEGKKMKTVVNELQQELDTQPVFKGTINKKSIKTLKPWMSKMDSFFKDLKLAYPKNIKALQEETDKIFGVLKISANKIFVKK